MSAWGAAWGDAWGDAWGVIAPIEGDVSHRVTLSPSDSSPHREQTHFEVVIACRSMTDDDVVPQSVSVRVDDFESGAALLAPTALSPAADVTFVVRAEYLTIQNDALPFETHVLTVTTNEGLGTERNEEYQFVVLNSRFVS